jgi:hypothetical protein
MLTPLISSWLSSSQLSSLSSSPSRVSYKVDLGIVWRGLRPRHHRINERIASLLIARFRKMPSETYAWCTHSMPQSKKNATSASSALDNGMSRCAFAATGR